MSSIVLNPTSTPSCGLTHGSLHPVKLRSNTVRCEQYLHRLVLLVRPSILYVVFVHIDQWMHSLESMHPWENYTPLWHCGQNRSTVSPLQWPTQMVHVHSCTWQHYVTWKGPRAVCRWNVFCLESRGEIGHDQYPQTMPHLSRCSIVQIQVVREKISF